jgi:hypothetical protein
VGRTQFGKLNIPWTACVQCGWIPNRRANEALTREHLPPKGIYLDGKRPNPHLIVPLCRECNSESSLDDEHLVQAMVLSSPGSEEAKQVWREQVLPNIKERPAHRVRLGKAVFPLPYKLPDGREIHLPGLAIDEVRLNRSLEKTARALYWVHSRKVMPRKVDFMFQLFNILDLQTPEQALQRMPSFQECVPGLYRNASSIRYFFYKGIFADVPWGSLWYFAFYRQNIAAVLSRAPEPSEDKSA